MDIERRYCVYEHVFPNGQRYVGMTCQKPTDRWGGRGQGYKMQSNMAPLIERYGWNNIEHNIVQEDLSLDDACALERKLITRNKQNNVSINEKPGGDAGMYEVPMFEIDGQRYTASEVARMSEIEDISAHDITNRLNEHGWTLEKALTQKKVPKNTKYEYNGKMYTTKELAELSQDPNLNMSNIANRINHHGWSVERAITQRKGTHKVEPGIGERIYEYKGKMYNSYELTQISPIEGITIGNITCRINNHGWSVERAIMTPLKKHNAKYKYQGKIYDSEGLAKIAVDPHMTVPKVNARLHKGWTVWEVINIPIGLKRSQFYKQQTQ